jgi:outer membrane lipoprotein-sorting protein
MVIRGEVVHQWDEDTQRVEKTSLSKNPVFKMAIQQLRDWLSGAYRSMLGEYRVTILEEEPISLEFIPRDAALAREVIDSVTVVFDRDEQYIRQIHIVEKRGDRTVLTFVDTLLNTPISPSAWQAKQDVQ